MNVYCDMDGVLVDLMKGYRDVAGVCLTKLHGVGDSKWDCALAVDHFWRNLPPMPDAHLLLDFFDRVVPNNRLFVLSAPQHCFPTCTAEKMYWIRDNAKVFHPKRVHVVDRKKKQEFAVNEDGTANILIDDYEKNIKEWTKAGGIGILHTNAVATMRELSNHLSSAKVA